MKRYEYKVVTRLWGRKRKMNELGYDGWELVAVDSAAMYFKREYDD